jgi:serine/threonine-protein kinase
MGIVSGPAERWRRIEALCEAALGHPPGDRAAFLASACDDTAVRRDVERLLTYAEASSQFLETPVERVAAAVLGMTHAAFSGRRLGPFEVGQLLGAGGMGEVYRARDAQLQRDVALKILPLALAIDPDRLARFKREAQLLASLNHPNIAAIYGFQEGPSSDGDPLPIHALVLELVEGPTLAERLEHGPIALDDAWPLAGQLAEALEAAHDHGIVHRDLKPANIKLRPDGTVKVLDFGLAKVWQPDAGADPIASPAITSASMRQRGTIIGTAAYMSPEQAKGRDADKRSDVWAFGAVLFEMLSGRRAFQGDGISDTLAAVLRQEPDWSALPASTPRPVRRLIERCLDRDLRRRLRDIGEARIVLGDPTGLAEGAQARAAGWQHSWSRLLPTVATAVLASVIAGGAAWYFKPASPAPVTRFPFMLPDGQLISSPANGLMIGLSTDGRRLVYATNNRLYVRSMSELDPRPIPGSERDPALTDPVFSPDGQSVAFYSPSEHAIKRIAITGGAAITICHADAPYGIDWQADRILFGQGRKGIMRVSSDGGTPEVVITVGPTEEAHGPRLLPDGQHVLFTVASGIDFNRWETALVVVQSLASSERKTLIHAGTDARYVAGHIVYALGGTLFAVPFDPERLEVKGGAVAMVDGVRRSAGRENGGAEFALSPAGTLAYIPGGTSGPEWGIQELLIADRDGHVELLKLPPGPYRGGPRISPDGSRIAVGTDDGREANIFSYELSGRSPMRRLTFAGHNRFPVWSADNARIAFQSDRDGDVAIFAQPADGTGVPERLTRPAADEQHTPEAWSPDGRTLLFSVTKGVDVSLWSLSLPGGVVRSLGGVHSNYPMGARFSPDGRWVAYARTEATVSKMAIYVQPFPAAGAKYQLFVKEPSGTAINTPHKIGWSPDGNSLFYIPRLGGFEMVPVTTSPSFAFGNAVTMPRGFAPGAPNSRTLYDVMPDGRFLGLRPVGQTDITNFAAPRVEVVLNWLEELRAKVRQP